MREEARRTVRSVLCEAHGLRYDPAVATGCVRCKGGTPTPRRTSRTKGSGPSGLLRLLLVAAVFFAALWMFLGKNPLSFLGGDREAPSTVLATEPFDDEPYEEVDEYAPPPPGAISGTAEELQDGARVHQERVKAYAKIE